ncbi:unnamed protein product [Closterium sp. Naga37s-1]|nr:unnamed protein product [Closterium sp. Naga37s-1]
MAPTVWIPPRGSESTAQEGLGVKWETEEAEEEQGSAEGDRGEAGDGRHEGEEIGKRGNAWGGGENAWGAMGRPLRLADGRAVMVRLTQHGAAGLKEEPADALCDRDAPTVISSATGDAAADAADAAATAAAAVPGSGTSVAVAQGSWLRVRVMGVVAITAADHAHLLVSPCCLHPSLACPPANHPLSSLSSVAAHCCPHPPCPPLLHHALPSSSALTSPSPALSSLRFSPPLSRTPHAPPPSRLSPPFSPPLQAQVQRMLRLSPACQAAVQAFHRRHPAAAAAGFGRLFRSPSLVEDLVKAQLLCNCEPLASSLAMARELCLLHRHHFGPPLGAPDSPECVGAFPEPHELAGLEISYLTSRCGLGPRIARLAADVASGAIDLEALQRDCLLENPPSGCDMAAVRAEREVAGQAAVGGGEGGAQTGEGEDMRGAGDVRVDARRGAGRRKRGRSWDENGRELKGVEAAVEKRTPVIRDDSPAAREAAPCHRSVPPTHSAMGGRRQAGTRKRGGSGRGKQGEVGWEEAVRQRVQRLPGFGPFSSANALQCMGVFCFVPADSETIRHLQARGHAGCTAGTVDALAARAYAAHAPFQFLAYWQSTRGTRASTMPGASLLFTLTPLILLPLARAHSLHLLCSAYAAVRGRHGRWEVWGEYERVFGRMAHLPPARYHAITGHNMRTAGGAGPGGRGGGGEANLGGGGDAVEGRGGGGGGGVMVSAQRRHTGRRRSQGGSTSPPSGCRREAEGDGGVDEGGDGRAGRSGESRGHAATAGVVRGAGEAAAATDAAGVAAGSGDGGVCVQCGVAGMGVRRSRRVMALRTQRGSASGTAACGACSAPSRGVEQQGVEGKSRERGSGNGRRRGHSGGSERGERTQGAGGGERRGIAAVGRGRGRGRSELEKDDVGGNEVSEERGEAATGMVVRSGEEQGRESVRAGAGQAAEQQQREIRQGQQRLEQQEGEQQGDEQHRGEQAWVQAEQQAGSFHAGGEMGTAGAWAVGAAQASSEGGMTGGKEAEVCGKSRAGHEEVGGRHRPNRRLLL